MADVDHLVGSIGLVLLLLHFEVFSLLEKLTRYNKVGMTTVSTEISRLGGDKSYETLS